MSRISFLNQKPGKRFSRRQEQGKARLTMPRSPSPPQTPPQPKKRYVAGAGLPLVPAGGAIPTTTFGCKEASMHRNKTALGQAELFRRAILRNGIMGGTMGIQPKETGKESHV